MKKGETFMLLTVTIESPAEKRSVDIRVNSENYLKDTLELLSRRGILYAGNLEERSEIYSVRNKEFIRIGKTYEQGNIHSGDILKLPA